MLLYEFFSAVVCTVVSSAALGYCYSWPNFNRRRQDVLECTWKSKNSRYRHVVPDLPAKSSSLDSSIDAIFILLQLCLKNVSSVYECSQHYPLKDNIDLTVITFSTFILKWKGVFYFQMYLVSSYLKENSHLSMITFVHIVFRKTLCLFGEHWYHAFFMLYCYYMTRRICGIKQIIIVAFCCWLPIMFTLFPSLAITSFLHFSYWGITFTQCATKCPGINCYYKHQSSSLLLLPLFL